MERKRELSSLPRATVISTRSMELLRSWGLADALRAGGVEVEWKMLACESLALASAGSAIPVGLPRREQSALISPAAPECVPQDHTERVLLDHLRSLGRARVLLGTEVVGLEQGDDGLPESSCATQTGGPSSVGLLEADDLRAQQHACAAERAEMVEQHALGVILRHALGCRRADQRALLAAR